MVTTALAGCVSVQPLEPVKNPPLEFRIDTTVPVEFVMPAKVGFRCAERGAKFLMLPGVNSQACANETLITMPNPCYTITGGWYARLLCHELAHANGWPHDHEGGNWMPDSIVHGEARPVTASIDEEMNPLLATPASLRIAQEAARAAEAGARDPARRTRAERNARPQPVVVRPPTKTARQAMAELAAMEAAQAAESVMLGESSDAVEQGPRVGEHDAVPGVSPKLETAAIVDAPADGAPKVAPGVTVALRGASSVRAVAAPPKRAGEAQASAPTESGEVGAASQPGDAAPSVAAHE